MGGSETVRSLLRAGDYAALVQAVEALPAEERETPQVQLAFGLALLREGHADAALAVARALVTLDRAMTDAYLLGALAHLDLGQERAARALIIRGLAIRPAHPSLLRLLAEQEGTPAALRAPWAARAFACAPSDPRTRHSYARILAQASGESRFTISPEAALEIARKAIAVDPNCAEARSALLFARQCLDLEPSDSMLQDAVGAAAAHAAGVEPRHWAGHKPASPLRIGFLACGLASSSVRHFVAGLFAHHDRTAVSLTLYDHCPPPGDTAYLALTRGIAVADVAGLGNAELADRISSDRIDVLVDLIGHGWYGRRLEVLARRPAPVQIAYCGYLGTLGLPTVDFFLSDTAIHPVDGKERYVERLLTLPNWICYAAPTGAPAVVDRPGGGPVVFGSFNQLGKLSPACLDLWREILEAVPASRLLVKRHDLAGHEPRLRQRLEAHGLPVERIDLDARSDLHRDHMAAYGQVDIALDTFPYSGATTVCEALWMGVPVVAMSGAPAVSRMSRSILRAAGLEGWASDSVDEAVAVARDLTADHEGRRRFRAESRAMLAASPLCDAAAFSRAFEQTCRRVAGV